MTKAIPYALVAIAWSTGLAAPAAAQIKTETGRLQDLISKLASSEYVLGEPNSDRRPYVDPAAVLTDFRHLASELAWGDVKTAARKAAPLNYEVVEFTDSQSKNEYYVLRENLDRVESIRGWGSYIVNPNSQIDALVEVPHPLADVQTPEVGGLVFETSGAKGFLLAGAHRAKADVPDLVDSIFHQVHAAWIGPFARLAAWQIHGFASFKHGFPKNAQVVASTGSGNVAPELSSLDALLEDNGFTSYVFNDRAADSRVNKRINRGVPGVTFSALAATKNEQGRLSRSLGGSFVHVELETRVRSSPSTREAAATVIAAAMAGAGNALAARADEESLTSNDPHESDDDLVPDISSQADREPHRVAANPAPAEPASHTAVASPEDAILP